MLNRDLFQSFRFLLAWAVTIYFAIVTVQWAWSWYAWLAGSDRFVGLLRRYLLVQGLRMRFKTFWGDVIICLLLCIAFLILWHAQSRMDEILRVLQSVPPIHGRSHSQPA